MGGTGLTIDLREWDSRFSFIGTMGLCLAFVFSCFASEAEELAFWGFGFALCLVVWYAWHATNQKFLIGFDDVVILSGLLGFTAGIAPGISVANGFDEMTVIASGLSFAGIFGALSTLVITWFFEKFPAYTFSLLMFLAVCATFSVFSIAAIPDAGAVYERESGKLQHGFAYLPVGMRFSERFETLPELKKTAKIETGVLRSNGKASGFLIEKRSIVVTFTAKNRADYERIQGVDLNGLSAKVLMDSGRENAVRAEIYRMIGLNWDGVQIAIVNI